MERRPALLPRATLAVQDTRWTAYIAYARIGAVKTAAYIGKLASAGMDPKLAQAHGEAIEALLSDEMVTNTHLDSKVKEIEAKLQELKADLIKWMIGQTIAVAALVFAIARLVK